jgi:hypothetical protein
MSNGEIFTFNQSDIYRILSLSGMSFVTPLVLVWLWLVKSIHVSGQGLWVPSEMIESQ